MQLYNVAAWINAEHERDEVPEWEAEVVADNVEEAYRKGRDLFQTERPTLDHEAFTIEASY